ncbi:MAG: hypothetical protein ABSE49_33835, partial [Polyangiaceae bacterium]
MMRSSAVGRRLTLLTMPLGLAAAVHCGPASSEGASAVAAEHDAGSDAVPPSSGSGSGSGSGVFS